MVLAICDIHQFEARKRTFECDSLANSVQFEWQRNVLDRCQRRQQIERLENKADSTTTQQCSFRVVERGNVRAFEKTCPVVGVSMAPSRFSSVLFPEPEGPMMASISPLRTTRSMPAPHRRASRRWRTIS